MQLYKMTVLFDHKAQIARKIQVSTGNREIEVHPVFYAYAQLAEKCCPHSKMTLVRMLMQDQPKLCSNEAVAIACGLMINSQTRLVEQDNDREPFQIDISFRAVDHTGLKSRPVYA